MGWVELSSFQDDTNLTSTGQFCPRYGMSSQLRALNVSEEMIRWRDRMDESSAQLRRQLVRPLDHQLMVVSAVTTARTKAVGAEGLLRIEAARDIAQEHSGVYDGAQYGLAFLSCRLLQPSQFDPLRVDVLEERLKQGTHQLSTLCVHEGCRFFGARLVARAA